jgi:hypothetical protein
MEYVFSNAAVARSFTAYMGTAVGVDAPSKWRIAVPGLPKGFNEVDLVAVGVILLISVCICYRYVSYSLTLIYLSICSEVCSPIMLGHSHCQIVVSHCIQLLPIYCCFLGY